MRLLREKHTYTVVKTEDKINAMLAAALPVLIGLTAPSSECAYLNYYFPRSLPLISSLVPSINSKCLAARTSANPTAICIADCQSLYSVYSQCTYPTNANALLHPRVGSSTACPAVPLNAVPVSPTSAILNAALTARLPSLLWKRIADAVALTASKDPKRCAVNSPQHHVLLY